MIYVELTPSEYAMAAMISAVRQSVNHWSRIKDKQMGGDDGLKIVIDGYVAELAFCKHFNIMPDITFDPRSGGWDCLYKGKKVDVKSTKTNKYDVYLPERKKKNDVDRYVWCWVNFRTVYIVGWFSPAEIFVDENLEQSPRPDERHYKINLKQAHKFKDESHTND